MRWTDIGAVLVYVAVIVLAASGCTGARYHQPDREPVEATEPFELGEWPDGRHIVCPRGEWDPQARCPWGAEFVGYDQAAAEAIEVYVEKAQANTAIAATQAEQIRALDAEAAAANETAAQLEAELQAVDRWRFIERLGWAGALALTIWVGL